MPAHTDVLQDTHCVATICMRRCDPGCDRSVHVQKQSPVNIEHFDFRPRLGTVVSPTVLRGNVMIRTHFLQGRGHVRTPTAGSMAQAMGGDHVAEQATIRAIFVVEFPDIGFSTMKAVLHQFPTTSPLFEHAKRSMLYAYSTSKENKT